jgi:integrase
MFGGCETTEKRPPTRPPMRYSLELKRPKDEKTTVNLVAYINQRRFKTGLGVAVPTASWDKANQRIKTGKSKNLIALQNELDNAVTAIENLHNQLVVNDGVELSVEAMREGVKRMKEGKQGVAEKVLTFNQWVDEFIKETERGERTNQKGFAINRATVQKYRTVQKVLDRFSKKVWGRPIRFDELNDVFVGKYTKFRSEGDKTAGIKGVGINTIAKDLAVLKTWMKNAFHREVHNNRKWESKAFKPREVKVTKPHLTIDEVKTLESFKIPKKVHNNGDERTSWNTVRDWFIISCWTAARVSDLKQFRDLIAIRYKENGGSCPDELEFVQAKTNSKVTVPLLAPVKRIVNHYGGNMPKLPNDQKMNIVVKEVCRAAGLDRVIENPSTRVQARGVERKHLWELVTNHTGRRTFATNVYNLDIISLGELMSLTGHESESSLMVYLNVSRLDVSRRAGLRLTAKAKELGL